MDAQKLIWCFWYFHIVCVTWILSLTIIGIDESICRSCMKRCCAVLCDWYLVLALHLSFSASVSSSILLYNWIQNDVLFFSTCLCNRKVRTKTRVPTVRSIVFVRWSGARQMFFIWGLRPEPLAEHLRHHHFNEFLFLSYLDSFKDLMIDVLRSHERHRHVRHWHEFNWNQEIENVYFVTS